MKITVLGSGSPEAYARRASSGYLIEIGADKILFDCGGGVFDNLLRAGLLPGDITHLFLSHLHSDHMMDYARLVHAAWDEGAAPLHVWGPAPIAAISDKYFGPKGALATDLVARTELKPSQEVWVARGGSLPRPWPAPAITEVTGGFAVDGADWTLTSCEVPHAQPHLHCMAFRIDAGGKSFVYSGDAGDCPELCTLAKGADLLIHWCYRLDGAPASAAMAALTPTPSQIADMAEAAGVKQLALTHFRKHMDESDAHAQALAAMRKRFSGQSEIAEDLNIYQL